MDTPKDRRDPAQKMKDLHVWLMNNKVSSRFPEKPALPTTWAAPTNPQAAAEIADFQNWVQQIQSPHRISF